MVNSNTPHSPIEHVPGPWKLKGTVYTLASYVSPKSASLLDTNATNKKHLFHPLEFTSSFSDGKFLGGLGMVQVIRYTESPVGPYGELLVVPGRFEREEMVRRGGGDGAEPTVGVVSRKKRRGENSRVTRIYVSQERTCWNGRKNWNIPKHLAHCSFTSLPERATSIAVYPFLPDANGIESLKSPIPFFEASFRPIPYLPAFPLSTAPATYLGLDLSIVKPPLPSGTGAFDELVGTEGQGWCSITPNEFSWKSRLGWWEFGRVKVEGNGEEDVLLASADNEGDRAREDGNEDWFENWWPGLTRWNLGIVQGETVIDFPTGERWV